MHRRLARSIRDTFLVTIGREPGCAVTTPWWATSMFHFIAAIAVLAGLATNGIHTPVLFFDHAPEWLRLAIYGNVISIATQALTHWILLGPQYHGHCSECGFCSAKLDHSTFRRHRAALSHLDAIGWDTTGDAEHCPSHPRAAIVHLNDSDWDTTDDAEDRPSHPRPVDTDDPQGRPILGGTAPI